MPFFLQHFFLPSCPGFGIATCYLFVIHSLACLLPNAAMSQYNPILIPGTHLTWSSPVTQIYQTLLSLLVTMQPPVAQSFCGQATQSWACWLCCLHTLNSRWATYNQMESSCVTEEGHFLRFVDMLGSLQPQYLNLQPRGTCETALANALEEPLLFGLIPPGLT